MFEPPATAKAPYKEHVVPQLTHLSSADACAQQQIGKPHSKPGTQRANATRLGLKSILNTTVHAGDLIYIPRGFPHMANSRPGEMSMHLTLTVCLHTIGACVAVSPLLSHNAFSLLSPLLSYAAGLCCCLTLLCYHHSCYHCSVFRFLSRRSACWTVQAPTAC